MKVKLEVLVPFTDKNDRTVRYKKGDTVAFDDIDRINDLIARGVCRLVAIEDDAPVASATNEIAIGDKAYPCCRKGRTGGRRGRRCEERRRSGRHQSPRCTDRGADRCARRGAGRKGGVTRNSV